MGQQRAASNLAQAHSIILVPRSDGANARRLQDGMAIAQFARRSPPVLSVKQLSSDRIAVFDQRRGKRCQTWTEYLWKCPLRHVCCVIIQLGWPTKIEVASSSLPGSAVVVVGDGCKQSVVLLAQSLKLVIGAELTCDSEEPKLDEGRQLSLGDRHRAAVRGTPPAACSADPRLAWVRCL